MTKDDDKKDVGNGTEEKSLDLPKSFIKSTAAFDVELLFAKDTLENSPSKDDAETVLDNLSKIFNDVRSSATTKDAVDVMITVLKTFSEIRVTCNQIIRTEGGKEFDQQFKLALNLNKGANSKLCHLRKEEFPVFDGTPRGFLSFRKDFKDLVQSKTSEEVALRRLKNESVQSGSFEHSIIRSKQTLDEALKALENIYGRKSIIRDTILADLRSIPVVISEANAEELRFIMGEIIRAQEDLLSCDSEEALGIEALSAIMTKIPEKIRLEVDCEILRKDLNTKGSIKLLLSKLEEYSTAYQVHQMRERIYGAQAPRQFAKGLLQSSQDSDPAENVVNPKSLGQKEGSNPDQQPPRNDNQPQGERKKKKCILHKGADNHSTVECKIFILQMTPQQQKELLDQNKACLVCFSTEHKSEECYTRTKCRVPNCPKQNHATLLHPACLAVMVAHNSSSKILNPPQTDLERRQLEFHLGTNTVRPGHHVYIILANGDKIKVNLLYDCGANISEVTESLIAKTGLKPVNKLSNLTMETAGRKNPEDWGETGLYRLPIYNQFGTLCAVLNCVSVAYIGTMDGGSVLETRKLFANQGLDSRNLMPLPSGEIEILIGNNHASLFPQPMGNVGEVVWAETYWGEILHGAHHTLPTRPNRFSSTTLGKASLQVAAKVLHHATIRTNQTQNKSAKPSTPAAAENTATVKLLTTKIQEENVFEYLCKIEDIPTCYKCGSCPPCPSKLSKEDERRLSVYKDCLRYNAEEKRFYTKMPWIKSFETLPDNEKSALKRLKSLTSETTKNLSFQSWYVQEFEKLIEKGVLILVSPEEARTWENDGQKVWYVSHFGVRNENSESTPLRVVFDATTPYRGIYLDSLWESPPNLTPLIPALIQRWRERRVTIQMDVSKCYWCVYLELVESHIHRVLWNGLDPNAPVLTYRMERNSWGMRPSGAIASIAMQLLAERFKDQYPAAHDFIMNSLYVDDGTSSVDTVEQAKELARQVSKVLGEGSFYLKHFIIGGIDFEIPERDHNQSESDEIPSTVRLPEEKERVLGVIWHSGNDTISINAKINFSKKKKGAYVSKDTNEENFDLEFPKVFTQRKYLSIISTVYDPDGLASPAVVPLRAELGPIFDLKLGWDASMPDDQRARCKELLRTLYGIRKIEFTRCLRPSNAIDKNPILIIFADSSQSAHACIAFFNWTCENGTRTSRLVRAKTRPISKKGPLANKIPRGELMAMRDAAVMKTFILENSSYQITRTVLLTDSMIGLGQIRKEPCNFNTWVANKVDEIQQNSSPSEWFHVRSEMNIADIATRGALPETLNSKSPWQLGAEFMKIADTGNWPVTPCEQVIQKEVELEIRIKDPRMFTMPKAEKGAKIFAKILTLTQIWSGQNRNDSDVHEYMDSLNIAPVDPNDNWLKLKRRYARVVNFVETTASKLKNRARLPPKFGELSKVDRNAWISENDKFAPTPREMKLAETFLLKQAQRSLDKNIERKHASLNPKRDGNGLWRAVGRTSQVITPPVIIPKDNPLATVLLRHFHSPCHSGADTTHSKLVRNGFWITNGRRMANSFVNDCAFCRRLRKQTFQVEMAPMKVDQCLESPVFRSVAIDLVGPFETVAERRPTRCYNPNTGKVWALIVVCKSSRAVHLEIMEGYDTDNFLLAFDAFTQVRGTPNQVVADMGSQIVSGAATLEDLWRHVDPTRLRNHLPGEITWDFIPSNAHHFLGCAERLVQVFKRTMEAITYSKRPKLTKLQFQRLLYAVANIMNDRPLTVGRLNVGKLDSDRIITPNDLLYGRSSSNVIPLVNFDENPMSDRRKYTRLLEVKEAILNDFWRKFEEQVFTVLLPREKWFKTGRQIRPGDIVLIRDTNSVRNHWSWGEVVDPLMSTDGRARKASIRYKTMQPNSVHEKMTSKYVVKCVRDLALILPVENR